MTEKHVKKSSTKSHVHTTSEAHTPAAETSETRSLETPTSSSAEPSVATSAPGDLPPTTGAPSPPPGWVAHPSRGKSRTGLRPKGAQITNAVSMATELAKSTTYAEDFGSRAPTRDHIVYLVTNAAKWRDTWQAARAFLTYAAEQRAAWENASIAQTESLKGAFDYAASRDGTIPEKYGATARFFGETKAIGSRAAATRKQNSKKTKVPTSDASPSPAPPADTSPSPNPPATK